MAPARSRSAFGNAEPPNPDCPLAAALAANEAIQPWLAGTATGYLLVGFSGGADSTSLLHALLQALADRHQIRAIHIDHGLQAESATWAQHCETEAIRLGVAFACHRVQVASSGNREAAARRARYRVWQNLLGPCDLLALAHHADDQAETRLWQFLTGRTAWGMPATRPLGAGCLVRPLLGVRRRDIVAYAQRNGLHWLEDPANTDVQQARNYLRHRVLPVVEAHFPDAVAKLAEPVRPPAEVPVPPLSAAAAGQQSIEAWLTAAGLPLPARAVTQLAQQSTAAAHRNPCVAICPGVKAWRHRGCWHLVRAVAGHASPKDEGSATVVVGTAAPLPAGTLRWREGELGLPAGLALRVCRRQGGERIRPLGRTHSKSVKALFQESHVPPWLRPEWPLLYAEDDLLAVPELAIAASAATPGGLLPTWQPNVQMLSQYAGIGGPRE